MLKRKRIYLLGDFTLDPERRLLTRRGIPVHLTQKPYRVLLYLIEHRDRVVKRSELMDRFWEGRDVYDESLHKAVGTIRKALDDRAAQVQFIETFYGEGYRYVGPFEEQFDVDGVQRGDSFLEPTKPEVTPQPSNGYHPVTIESEGSPTPSSSQAVGVEPRPPRRLILVAVTAAAVVVALVTLLAWRSRVPQAKSMAQPITSIAVLPFRNLTGDPANEYLSDGLTDQLINTLANVEGLKVSARGSSFTFCQQSCKTDPLAIIQN